MTELRVERYKLFEIDDAAYGRLVMKLANDLKNPFAESTVVQVRHYHEGHPRAYVERPLVCMNPYNRNAWYVLSPVGYDDSCFVPEEGKLIEKNAKLIMGDLMGQGALMSEGSVAYKPMGTSLPDDYNPATSLHHSVNNGTHRPDHQCACFFLDRKALDESALLSYGFQDAAGGASIRSLSYEGQEFILCCSGMNSRRPAAYIPVDIALFLWIEADLNDAELRISPPPRPEKLSFSIKTPEVRGLRAEIS